MGLVAYRAEAQPRDVTMAYCERTDIEDVFGIGNVASWADLDNDKSPVKIKARIERAIAKASATSGGSGRVASPSILFTARWTWFLVASPLPVR